MTTVTTTPFGRRPVTAGQVKLTALAARPAPCPGVDKWQVLDDLTTAASAFGLGHRTLSVLQVLLSFHRERELTDGASLIVFASNARLSERAHGMPDSTLRRHLAALVEAGMIARHDSPNGKRYARTGSGGEVVRAFGFDLRPLLVRSAEIAREARQVEAVAARCVLLREEVILLLRDAEKLAEFAGSDALFDASRLIRRDLRRRLDEVDLIGLRDRLRALVERVTDEVRPEVDKPVETIELSACDSENERHKQDSDKTLIESERPLDIDLRGVLNACPDVLPYAVRPVRSWEDFTRLMAGLAPMSGVDVATWREACRLMGPVGASVTVAAIVQRIGAIRSPGAYLRTLARKAGEGGFSPETLVRSMQARSA
ncbi:hypothetical protein ATO6_20225 [Oceanicola sp. 22II-s10i]|uniref:plasmid replication protein RepC n=1 Tax=Oceanicola sp. 22II-s10i TaxID=1317116 RepID=UPI000B6540B1|nr:plasmid replication protein RepC [Oceanicola sp. 22II-s10i]OWU83223.1 hypothetical protein ATO6_20225 [Oceanicola sp. 22II-s10i]